MKINLEKHDMKVCLACLFLAIAWLSLIGMPMAFLETELDWDLFITAFGIPFTGIAEAFFMLYLGSKKHGW